MELYPSQKNKSSKTKIAQVFLTLFQVSNKITWWQSIDNRKLCTKFQETTTTRRQVKFVTLELYNVHNSKEILATTQKSAHFF